MTITWWLIVSTILIWIAWDIFAYLKWGNPATESVLIFKFTRLAPGALLAIGYVLGHLTWQVHICP